MPLEKIEAPYVRNQLQRFQQGDILRDLSVAEIADVVGEDLDIKHRQMPYCVVLSQDCDLEHDFNLRANAQSNSDDKILPALLLCPAYLADDLKHGVHLQDEKKRMQRIGSEEWKKMRTNQVYRYHYLEAWQDLQVPELVIDFKHYFTVASAMLYREESRKCYLATLEILYREHLSARFAHYLSRVGLPELTSP